MTATLVQLVDGRMVQSCAEEWRAETLARYVLNLHQLDIRRAWLNDFERRNGKEETDKLREKMTELHTATHSQSEK